MTDMPSNLPPDPGARFDPDSFQMARAAAGLPACLRGVRGRPPAHPANAAARAAPYGYFLIGSIFHYLGPACAALLFTAVAPLGVAWLRIASAAIVFALWRRPWKTVRTMAPRDLRLIGALGLTLAAMNASFYLAIAHLPLATVGAIEFLGPIAIAAAGMRDSRNRVALAMAVVGVYLLTEVRFAGEPLGYLFAFANCGLFMAYLLIGHRLAAQGAASGIDRLAAAMTVAALIATPWCLPDALPAFGTPALILAGIGVGLSSSVIPYVTDQLAMARLPRETFALLLAILPAMAALIGLVVLRQRLLPAELSGIAMVAAGIALHRPRPGGIQPSNAREQS